MKILVETARINDLGGIVPCIEQLVRGLKANGHEVEAVWSGPNTLRQKTGSPTERRIETVYRKARTAHAPWQRYMDGTGYWFRNSLEWWDMPVLSWQDIAERECDLIIHAVPVPTLSRNTRGVGQGWQDMYLFTNAHKQLVYIHDVHFEQRYPHLIEVAPAIDGAICVHEAAFHSTEALPIPRDFIPNPHDISVEHGNCIANRADRIISLQNFKAWKHVDDLIRAIQHLIFTHAVVAGGGIEQQYMTAGPDKIKSKYLEDGEPIWDLAAKAGMEYLSYISSEERDQELRLARCLIDTSWSTLHEQYGCHFNRVFVEAMDAGAVPIVTKSAMKGSTLFKEEENYIAYDHSLPKEDPQGFADFIDGTMARTKKLEEIAFNNIEMLECFDYRHIAERVGELCDVENQTVMPILS